MTFNVYNPSQLDALLGIWNWYQIPKIAQFFYVKKRRFILLFRNYFIPKKKRKYHKRRRHVFYHDGSTEYTWDSSFCRCQNSEMQNSFSLKWCQTTVSIFFILEIKRFLKIFLYYFTWLHINILFYNFLQRRMLRKSTSETATTLKVCLLRITCRKIKDITFVFKYSSLQLLTSMMPLLRRLKVSLKDWTDFFPSWKFKKCKARQYWLFKADFGSYTPVFIDNEDQSADKKTPFPREFPQLGLSIYVGKWLLHSFRIDDLAICKATTEEQRG